MRARRKPESRLRFNVGEWDRIADTLGLKTDADKARFLGVDPSNYHRITRDQTHPSEPFVARTLKALADHADVTFERLFTVVDVQPEPVAVTP